MAYTNIDDPSEHFNTILYSGNSGNPRSLTGVGFKPDFLWVKRRNASERHLLTNAQMGVESGAYKWLDSGDSADDFGGGYGVASFDTDGFTFKGVDATWNASGNTYVAWNWKANGGTTSTNTDGTITSTVQANTDAGFSIFTYTGTGAELPSIGHGLGKAADIYFQKNRSSSASWAVLGKMVSAPSGGANRYLLLNQTNAQGGASQGPGNATTIQTWSDATGNASGDEYVVYAFTSKQGFSKINYYIGNGNADGPFVYTGFKPAFVMIKPLSYVESWVIIDAKRNPSNQAMLQLNPNSSGAEYNGASVTNGIDILSNGFKVRTSRTELNTSGGSLIYMAFAENPFVTSTGMPTTAR